MAGELDWKRCADMNPERMNEFLAQVSPAQPDAFILMILDGASSHKSRDLRGAENLRLHRVARIESPGACLGRTAGEGVFQPGLRLAGGRHRPVGVRLAPTGGQPGGPPQSDGVALDCESQRERDLE